MQGLFLSSCLLVFLPFAFVSRASRVIMSSISLFIILRNSTGGSLSASLRASTTISISGMLA